MSYLVEEIDLEERVFLSLKWFEALLYLRAAKTFEIVRTLTIDAQSQPNAVTMGCDDERTHKTTGSFETIPIVYRDLETFHDKYLVRTRLLATFDDKHHSLL